MIQVGDLRKLGTLATFSEGDLGLLLSVAPERTLASGSILYAQGERARSCFLLVRGFVQVERVRASSTQVVATLRPGTFVGQIALLDHGKRTATVRAVTECEGLELRSEIVEQLMMGSTPLALAFQDQLAIAGIRQYRQAMALLASASPPQTPPDPERGRQLDQVQAYLADSGISLDEADSVDFVHDVAQQRKSRF
ncbi:MAG: cyclic nucleotide-binding domain-containing protein [Polyangiaceae bacterium]|nr:cyclic nucleotide-binding domain-containing protein [Polyangiaceae bacterium]